MGGFVGEAGEGQEESRDSAPEPLGRSVLPEVWMTHTFTLESRHFSFRDLLFLLLLSHSVVSMNAGNLLFQIKSLEDASYSRSPQPPPPSSWVLSTEAAPP